MSKWPFGLGLCRSIDINTNTYFTLVKIFMEKNTLLESAYKLCVFIKIKFDGSRFQKMGNSARNSRNKFVFCRGFGCVWEVLGVLTPI